MSSTSNLNPCLEREKEVTSATKSSIDCRQATVLAKNENNKVNMLCNLAVVR